MMMLVPLRERRDMRNSLQVASEKAMYNQEKSSHWGLESVSTLTLNPNVPNCKR